MNPLSKRLASLRLKVRLLDGWLGVCTLVAVTLGVIVAEGVIDFWLHLPNLVRAGLLVGLLVAVSYVAYRLILRPFSRRCDDLNLALRIEEVYPELNDSLATTVQFLHQTPDDKARVGGSDAMRERTVRETVDKASSYDFGRILDRRAALMSGIAACCLLLIAGAFLWMNSVYSKIAVKRFVEPFGMHTWTQISVARLTPARQNAEDQWKPVDSKATDRIANGTKYWIKVNLFGQMPRKPEAKVEIQGSIKAEKVQPLKISDDKLSASFEMLVSQPDQPQKFKFKIVANDGVFPPRSGTWHEVEVLPPPQLVEPPHIAVYPPKYTGLRSPQVLEPGKSLVNIYAGSTVVLRGRADRELEQAWIEYQPEKEKLVDAARLVGLGQSNALVAAALMAGGHEVWGSFPARLDPDRRGFEIAIQPWLTGKFVLHLLDPDDLSSSISVDLTVNVDPVPEVKLVAPRSSVTIRPGGMVPFKFNVTDEEFGIKSVYLEYRTKRAGAERAGEVKRILVHDADGFIRSMPQILANVSKAPLARQFPLVNPEIRRRHQRLDFSTIWTLPKDEFNEGDLVEVIIAADDFCDVYPIREPGRSRSIELRILNNITGPIVPALKEIHDELKKIIKLEEKALDTVTATRKKNKFEPKLLENFIENGEQPQTEVVERTETLRTKLKEIRETLQNNRLTEEGVYKEANKIQGVLDSISQSELPQITPKLEEVRGAISKGGEATPKTQKQLDEAARLQDNVLKALRELLYKLDPDIRMNELAAKAMELRQKAKDVEQTLTEINSGKKAAEDNPNLSPDEKAVFKKALEERIKQAKADQQELANQTEKLIQEMQDAKAAFERNNDKPNADKVEEAIKKAVPEHEPKVEPKQNPMPEKDKTPLNAEMKRIANELKGDNVQQKEISAQKEVVKKLDEVAQSLQGKNIDQTKDQIRERRELEDKIENLAKKNEELRQEAEKNRKNENMDERLKKNEEIAAEMGRLQEKIEETRRELARLNEQRAADELKQAAEAIERAKEKVQQDGNPDAEQKKAKDEMKRAQNELKQAEEELARELLVKIADQLEGLKVRQVISVERSEELHAKILEKKSWNDDYLDTIDGNIDAQKGLADETDTVKDKLKDAKVFHTLLEMAKKSMDDAGESMDKRREKGKERRYEDKGEMMPEEDLKDEGLRHDKTVRHQKQAVKKLEILLDSIKEEIARRDEKKDLAQNEPPNNPENPDPNNDQPKTRSGDGLPPAAELKALRGAQFDLNERFDEFNKNNPDPDKMDDDQKDLLKALTEEQRQLGQLFREMTAAMDQQAPAPAPNEKNGKEGDKK